MPLIKITEEDEGERLDLFLTRKMTSSRSSIQKLIKNGNVTVDDKAAKPNYIVQKNDEIFYPEVEPPIQTKDGVTPILEIVYQDDDLVIINKPSGLLVHEAYKNENRHTVVDALLELYPEIANVGDDPKRPGIVHRLDKDVSGLLVIAKTQEAFEYLKKQFQNRTIKKEYLALVYGRLPKDNDVVNLKITRSKSKGRMVARPQSQEGKEALTEYDVIERFATTTFARVKIQTGRTHQIRVHFQALGYPIVGDKLYQLKKMKYRQIQINRIFLHATSLSLKLPSGKIKSFKSPLPDDLQLLLRNLNKV